MTIMNHSTTQYENITKKKMNKSTSASYSNNNKITMNNYLFNTPSTTTTIVPTIVPTTSSSYRLIQNPYPSQQQQQTAMTFENKRALFNGNSSKYFQTIQDAAETNNNKLYHSNSVESLINTDTSLQLTSSSSTATSTFTNNNRKSAFQVLKPRSTTITNDFPLNNNNNLTTTNSNNSINTMNNLQQNNREFSEKLYAYKTKIASNPTTTSTITKASTPPVAHTTRYSYSTKKHDNLDTAAQLPPQQPLPTVNDLLFINNYNFGNQNYNNNKLTNIIDTNNYSLGCTNTIHDENNDDFELSSSLTNFEQKLYNTTVNNTLPSAFTNITTATTTTSTAQPPTTILMNSFQFFSHFDVQSILFNYNDIKLKKDSLHTSLNIRTGASAASRQGSMENLNKIPINSMSSLPAMTSNFEQNYLTRVNNQYFNGNVKNESISLSSSSSPRPSLTNTQSSSSSSSSNVEQDTIKKLLSNDSASLIVMSDLVDHCPYFKLECGGDSFKGLGLVKESQRRFMKLNSVSLLDKITNYKKELSDSIEANFNEPFTIEYQDYGAYFYRYYFFNQGLLKFIKKNCKIS
jgi:hypothetical protein